MNKAAREKFNTLIPFDEFWELYNYKRAKTAARIAWGKLPGHKRQLAMDHLHTRLSSWWGSRNYASAFIEREGWLIDTNLSRHNYI
tara:strand:+ start:956 stop:1213 length:258 start_codon:yes stop_codon:yes gene_type:complete